MKLNAKYKLLSGLAIAAVLTGCATQIAAPVSSIEPKRNEIDVAQRALPTKISNVEQAAHYQHVYVDSTSDSAQSLQTISIEDAVKSNVLASSDLQVKPLSDIDKKSLNWAVFETAAKSPSEIEGVGGVGVESANFAEVNFSLNGTEILNSDHITALVDKSRRVSGIFHVVGYTDETGTEFGNKRLAVDRAKSVAKALIAAGVNQSRVLDAGAGVSRLYPSLEANRRASVTFRIVE